MSRPLQLTQWHRELIDRFPELPTGIPTTALDAYDFWTQTLWGAAGWARRITDPAAVAQLATT